MSKQIVRAHFIKKCREHFGVSLDDCQVDAIGQRCHDGSAFKIRNESDTIGLYRVRIGEELAIVIYDRDRETVLTALPIAWLGRLHKADRERALIEAEDQFAKV